MSTRWLQVALLSAASWALHPAAHAQTVSWNAYNDFYFSPSAAGWAGATNGTGSAWGYYMGNVNGSSFPDRIGTYLSSGQLYKYSDANPAGASDGTKYSTSKWDSTGGAGFARYEDTLPWGTSLGRFDTSNTWWDGAPGYSQGLRNLIWMQANSIGNPAAEGIASVLTWKAPATGSYVITGRFVAANQPANGASAAIVDNQGTTLLARTILSNNTVSSFSYTKSYNAGDVIQFQVGSDFKAGNAVGLQVDIRFRWSAYSDFYLSPSADGWAGATSGTGNAWGYYMGNVNGLDFPNRIGAYLNSGQIYKLSDANPVDASDTNRYSTSLWDGTGGAGFARYQYSPYGTSLGRFDTSNTWWDGAPGYDQNLSNLIWMQAGNLGNPSAEGIASVLTWKAPSTGSYVINGRFVAANQPANGASAAIVDSRGDTLLLPRTSLANNTVKNFSLTNHYNAGDVVQFQVGSDFKTGNAVGLQVDVENVPISNWNAKRDFYLSKIATTTSVGATNPAGVSWGGPKDPSESGSAWGYYAANVNGLNMPEQIGSYFTLEGSGSGSANLYRYSSHSPLGNTGYFFNRTTFDPIGGPGLPAYRDDQGWGTSICFFDFPWFEGAPGTTTESRGGVYMQAGWLGASTSEGIAPVVTWTAPRSGIYDFKGSFQVGDNGAGYGASIAIVASTSTDSIIMPKISATQGMDHPFAFRRTLNQGDVIQFQVGSDLKTAAPVALNADVTRVGNVNQKVPSSVSLAGSPTLAYSESGATPALTVLGSSNPPTYLYKGVDGTTYGPSSTAPTNRGRYELTVTTADDTNWSATTNKFYYSVGTFNAFKDFWWNREAGRAAWIDPAQALAQGRSQGTPTAKNAWGYGLIQSTTNLITDANVNKTFLALAGYSHNSSPLSWTYHNGDPAGTRVSWIAANSTNAVLALTPSAGVAGADGSAAAVRWTAPAAGTYRFQGSFVSQGSNSMSVAIQTTGGDEGNVVDNAVYLARTTVAASATQAFDFTNYIEANQTVTWVVGSDGASDGDVMLLSADVSDVLGTPTSAVPPTITSTNAFSATVGVAFSNNITASGDAPVVFSGTDLPSGLSVASGGALTGTPTAAGTFSATLTATNAAGTNNQTATFTIAKGEQTLVLGSLGSTTISAGSTTTVTASAGSGTGAYEFRQDGGTGSVGFTGTGDSRTINPISAGTAVIQVRRVADANYNDSPWVSAGTLTITPADSSFSGWLGANPSSAALLLQYAYGAASASSAVNRSNLPAMTLSNGNLLLTYYVRKNATNPNLVTPEVHTNLAVASGWSDVPAGSITTLGTNTVDGVQVIQRRASVPVDGSRKFLRLKIAE